MACFWILYFLLSLCCSVMSDSLQPHVLQHTMPPCPSLSAGVCSDLCPLSQWCHPTILSSVTHFSSCLQSFPASGSFPMSRLCIRWPKYCSFSFSISPSSGYSGLISFKISFWSCCPRGSRESSPAPQSESINSSLSAFFMVQLSCWYMTAKTTAWTTWTFVSKIFSSVDLLISVPCCLVWYSLIVSWVKWDRVNPTDFAF